MQVFLTAFMVRPILGSVRPTLKIFPEKPSDCVAKVILQHFVCLFSSA